MSTALSTSLVGSSFTLPMQMRDSASTDPPVQPSSQNEANLCASSSGEQQSTTDVTSPKVPTSTGNSLSTVPDTEGVAATVTVPIGSPHLPGAPSLLPSSLGSPLSSRMPSPQHSLPPGKDQDASVDHPMNEDTLKEAYQRRSMSEEHTPPPHGVNEDESDLDATSRLAAQKAPIPPARHVMLSPSPSSSSSLTTVPPSMRSSPPQSLSHSQYQETGDDDDTDEAVPADDAERPSVSKENSVRPRSAPPIRSLSTHQQHSGKNDNSESGSETDSDSSRHSLPHREVDDIDEDGDTRIKAKTRLSTKKNDDSESSSDTDSDPSSHSSQTRGNKGFDEEVSEEEDSEESNDMDVDGTYGESPKKIKLARASHTLKAAGNAMDVDSPQPPTRKKKTPRSAATPMDVDSPKPSAMKKNTPCSATTSNSTSAVAAKTANSTRKRKREKNTVKSAEFIEDDTPDMSIRNTPFPDRFKIELAEVSLEVTDEPVHQLELPPFTVFSPEGKAHEIVFRAHVGIFFLFKTRSLSHSHHS
jgi:hypothetical protein